MEIKHFSLQDNALFYIIVNNRLSKMENQPNMNVLQQQQLKDAANRHHAAAEFVIRALDNPDPTIMLGIILATIIVIYILYIFFFKQHISGIWLDTKTNQLHHICHNILTDRLTVDSEIPGELDGLVVYAQFKDQQQMGLIMADKLTWLNGNMWIKVRVD